MVVYSKKRNLLSDVSKTAVCPFVQKVINMWTVVISSVD